MFIGVVNEIVVAVSKSDLTGIFAGDVFEVDSAKVGDTYAGGSVSSMLSVIRARAKISALYVAAMTILKGAYTQEEVDTFHRKSTAATSYAAGLATDSHKYYLAKIDGVVNGAVPLSDAEKSAEVAGIDAAGTAMIEARVAKILIAESQFDFYSAKIEQVRNTHLDQLSEGADNQPVVDSLAAAYAAMS